ncbi:Crp/Fnr family transcriptional regulator [candidate division KSB1 bacterium]
MIVDKKYMEDLVSKDSFFHHLDNETIEYLFYVGKIRHHERNGVIFLESEEAHHFYLILEGHIKISRLDQSGKEVIIAILTPGNFFGDMGILDGMPRSTDAISESKSSVLMIRDEDFYKLIEKKPQVTIELLKELAHRIRNSDSQIKGLSLLNASGKVASAILRWAQDQGVAYGETIEIKGVPKQEEMASYVGLTRETFNRVLKDFEKHGFISKPRSSTIQINNFKEFKKIYGPLF